MSQNRTVLMSDREKASGNAPSKEGSVEETGINLLPEGLPQAELVRCSCGCRFRWPDPPSERASLGESASPQGHEDGTAVATCPVCGSSVPLPSSGQIK